MIWARTLMFVSLHIARGAGAASWLMKPVASTGYRISGAQYKMKTQGLLLKTIQNFKTALAEH